MNTLTDIQEGKLIVHNDFLKNYIKRGTLLSLRNRKKVLVVNKSYVIYDSVLALYSKNAEMLAQLPSKESLLAEIQARLTANKQVDNKINDLATANDVNNSVKEVKNFFEITKKQHYSKDLAFYLKKTGKTDKSSELANLACVYRILATVNGKNSVKALGISGIENKEDLATKLYDLGTKNGFIKMRQGWFEVKATEFKKKLVDENEALLMLTHGNEKNKNAGKLVTNDLAKLVLLSMWVNKDSDIKNSEAWIVRNYNELAKGNTGFVDTTTGELIAENSQLPVLSENTIRNFLNLPYNQAVFSKYRHGSKYYKDSFRPYVLGIMPKYSLSMCSLDGFTMPFVRTKQNSKDSGFKRFKVVFVFDVASQAITGYHWGLSEGKEVFKGAINMMLRKYGRIPLEIQQDNAARFLQNEYMMPIEGNEQLASIFPFVTFPEPYNAQAKPVERLLGMFDEEVLRNQKGWMGKNIKGTKSVDSMRNPDYVPHSYTDKEFAECLHLWVNEWNNNVSQTKSHTTAQTKVYATGTRIENFLGNINPECQEVSSEILYGFCSEMTERQIKNGFVRLEHNFREYTYLVDDYEYVLSQIKYNRVRVRFIPEKLNNEVAIYAMIDEKDSSKDRFLTICKSANRVQRSKAEQDEIDRKELGVYMARKASFDKEVELQNEKLLQLSKQNVNAFENDLKSVCEDTNTGDKYTNSEMSEMSESEAEAILQAGYTDKKLMEEAEEVLSSKQFDKKKMDLLKMYK